MTNLVLVRSTPTVSPKREFNQAAPIRIAFVPATPFSAAGLEVILRLGDVDIAIDQVPADQFDISDVRQTYSDAFNSLSLVSQTAGEGGFFLDGWTVEGPAFERGEGRSFVAAYRGAYVLNTYLALETGTEARYRLNLEPDLNRRYSDLLTYDV